MPTAARKKIARNRSSLSRSCCSTPLRCASARSFALLKALKVTAARHEHRGVGHHPILRKQIGKYQAHGHGSKAGANQSRAQAASPDAQDKRQEDQWPRVYISGQQEADPTATATLDTTAP